MQLLDSVFSRAHLIDSLFQVIENVYTDDKILTYVSVAGFGVLSCVPWSLLCWSQQGLLLPGLSLLTNGKNYLQPLQLKCN